jgi:hypothetical protein
MIATSWLAPELWQEKQEEVIREVLGDGLDWAEYLRLVNRHRTPALSWAALQRVSGLEIPEFIRQELYKGSKGCQMRAIRHAMRLAEVLKTFNSAGIAVMPLKGPLLSLALYGDLGLRQSHDLDMACSPRDLSPARVCLEGLGWHSEESAASLTPRQWQSFLRNEQHLSFVHSQTGDLLELHWRNLYETTDQTSTKWARSYTSVWQGCSYQVMHPVDLILYLCNHGGGHAWFRAKWLGDLARLHTEGKVDWALCLEHARKFGHERVLLSSLLLLKEVYELPVPKLAQAQWRSLPPFLIKRAHHALKAPEANSVLATLMESIYIYRYDQLVLPRQGWWKSLAKFLYRRADYHILRLPDWLFWAYVPLRPVLWIWRRIVRGGAGQQA